MEKYNKRIADEMLSRKLAGKGAVLIEGAKWWPQRPSAAKAAG